MKLWRDVWRVQGPPKLHHFLCRACKVSIGVKERLCWRHVSDVATCSIFGEPNESICHALFSCKYALAIWQVSTFGSLLSNIPYTSFDDVFSWLMAQCTRDELHTICSLIYVGSMVFS